MMPNKRLITIVGVAMIALLLYPPVFNCNIDDICSQVGTHRLLWEDWMKVYETTKYLVIFKIDLTRLALYELALAGVGALIHFVTRK